MLLPAEPSPQPECALYMGQLPRVPSTPFDSSFTFAFIPSFSPQTLTSVQKAKLGISHKMLSRVGHDSCPHKAYSFVGTDFFPIIKLHIYIIFPI